MSAAIPSFADYLAAPIGSRARDDIYEIWYLAWRAGSKDAEALLNRYLTFNFHAERMADIARRAFRNPTFDISGKLPSDGNSYDGDGGREQADHLDDNRGRA